jgi:hypothetical protein
MPFNKYKGEPWGRGTVRSKAYSVLEGSLIKVGY